MSTTTANPAYAISAGTITRTAYARTQRRWRSATVTSGVVRTTPVVVDGDSPERLEALARLVAGYLMQSGYDVARTGAVLTVTLPSDDPDATMVYTRTCNAAHVGCTCTDDKQHREWVEANSEPVDVTDLRDGDVVFLCGTWQHLDDVRRDGDAVRATVNGGAAYLGPSRTGYARLTLALCPGCRQVITVVPDDGGAYTECGGEGNGGCDVWIDGDPACERAHAAALTASGF